MIGKRKAYLIIGADGHLGTTLIHFLEGKDCLVRALIFRDPFYHSNAENVRYFKGSVSDEESLIPLFEGLNDYDIVVLHLSAIIDIAHWELYPLILDVNVEGVKRVFSLFEEANGKRFLYVSSVDVFKSIPTVVNETSSMVSVKDKASAYQKSKAMATQFILDKEKEGANATIIYPSGVIGPYNEGGNALVQLLRDYLKGKLPGVVPGKYDLVDVRDVAKSLIALSEDGYAGENFIIAGHEISLKAFVLAAKAWNQGKGRKVLVFPLWLAYLGLPFVNLHCKIHHLRPLYTSFSLHVIKHANSFSAQKAIDTLNYLPRPIEESIAATLSYLRENGEI